MIGPKTAKRRSAFRRANRAMPRRRIDIAIEAIDYKNPDLLKKFVTESGKILPRRVTGMPAHLHRRITREIKRSRSVSRIHESHPTGRLRTPAVCSGKGNRETCSCAKRDGP